MSYFLGCDVSKQKLDVALVDEHGRVQWQDVIDNEPEAIMVLLLTLQGAYLTESPAATLHDPHKAMPGSAGFTCVAESTGTLHQLFAETCFALGVPCLVYNPILTRQQIKGSIRVRKTDKTDAVHIARIGLRGDGRLYLPDKYKQTRYEARAISQLAKLSSQAMRFTAHAETMLSGSGSQTALDLLHGIQEQVEAARKQFVADVAAHAPADLFILLQTIPGVGPYVAASFIGEIQDMHKFRHAHGSKALMAYAGLDPKIRRSGTSLNSAGKLTKRGSPHLRRAAFISASVARRCNPALMVYYKKKRDEGKSYTVATCAVARKQLAIVRAVWLSGKPFKIHQSDDSIMGN